jgi:hypothetical protein
MMGGAVALIDRRKRERRDPIPAFHVLQDLVEYLQRRFSAMTGWPRPRFTSTSPAATSRRSTN